MQSHNTKVYLWGKHNKIDLANVDVIEAGVGIVTGDIQFIHAANANKRIKHKSTTKAD